MCQKKVSSARPRLHATVVSVSFLPMFCDINKTKSGAFLESREKLGKKIYEAQWLWTTPFTRQYERQNSWESIVCQQERSIGKQKSLLLGIKCICVWSLVLPLCIRCDEGMAFFIYSIDEDINSASHSPPQSYRAWLFIYHLVLHFFLFFEF